MSIDASYRQELGVIYDTINIFVMKLNDRQIWLDRATQKFAKTEDSLHMDFWLSQFDNVPQELMIFFYLKDQSCFAFLTHVFATIMQKTNGTATVNDFIEYIKNEAEMTSNLSNFYLGKELADKYEFREELCKREDLDNLLRFQLLGYAVAPRIYLYQLRNLFKTFYDKVMDIYKEKANDILKYQEEITGTKLYEIASLYHHTDIVEKNLRQENFVLIYTITLILKNCIMFEIESPVKWCILGIDYQRQVNEDEKIMLDVAALGNSFGDHHRLSIIGLILRNGELTVSDMANRLGLAVNSVSYHLDIMKKANLLCSRTKGKSTVFWLNTKVCAIISAILEHWSKGGDDFEASVDKAGGYNINPF